MAIKRSLPIFPSINKLIIQKIEIKFYSKKKQMQLFINVKENLKSAY